MKEYKMDKGGGSDYKSKLFGKMVYLPSLIPAINVLSDGKIDSWDAPSIVAAGVFLGFGYAVNKFSDYFFGEKEPGPVKTGGARRSETAVSGVAGETGREGNLFDETIEGLAGVNKSLRKLNGELKKISRSQKETTMKLKEIDRSLKKTLPLVRGRGEKVVGLDSPEEWIKYDYRGLPMAGHPFGGYLPESVN